MRAHGVQPHAHSEPAIVAGLAKTTLRPNPNIDWDAWIADYSRVRDAIERTYLDQFKEMAGQFHRAKVGIFSAAEEHGIYMSS